VLRDIDLVLDTIGDDTPHRSLAVLRPGGHLVTAAAESDTDLSEKAKAAGLRFSGIAVDQDPVALHRLLELVEQGALRVRVQGTFSFENAAEAHRILDDGHVQGKLVLTA
jgi:NADPH:quinone reductase-like Zn-dependent oxidoreductase